MVLSMVMLYIAILVEKMNKNLLTIKILERGKSLKEKVLVWFG